MSDTAKQKFLHHLNNLDASLQEILKILEHDAEQRKRVKAFNQHHNNQELHKFFPVR